MITLPCFLRSRSFGSSGLGEKDRYLIRRTTSFEYFGTNFEVMVG